jgi:actin related protein 2/3 complex subunit 3
MPVYHSEIKDVANCRQLCSTAILPLKTSVKGPAPPSLDNAKDVVDEAIEFFRANVLFRSFTPQGPADLLLAYLTIYITELLRFFAKDKTGAEAKKNVTRISLDQRFPIPGDKDFCLGGFFNAPTSSTDSDAIRQYFLQLRQECANRLLDRIYNTDGTQNKWWFQFSKRKFLNIDATGAAAR